MCVCAVYIKVITMFSGQATYDELMNSFIMWFFIVIIMVVISRFEGIFIADFAVNGYMNTVICCKIYRHQCAFP